MSDLTPPLTTPTDKQITNEAASLLGYYHFELDRYTIHQLVDHWGQQFPTHWVRLAIIEALYQGRYKSISVEQILNLWHRRGQPRHHFNHEFERIVCNKLPQIPNLHRPGLNTVAADGHSNQGHSSQPSSEPIGLRSPTWHPGLLPPSPELVSLRAALNTEVQPEEPTVREQATLPAKLENFRSGALPISFKIHTHKTGQTQLSPPAASTMGTARAQAGSSSPVLPRFEPPLLQNPGDEIIQDFVPESGSSEFYSRLKAVAHSPDQSAESYAPGLLPLPQTEAARQVGLPESQALVSESSTPVIGIS
ncbi:MAG TPA: hypothetical protein V6C46_01180 [Coleofasciculaceae cyanobacterium]